jgi:type I restriction enzyme R subunit
VVDFADISKEFDITNKAYFEELNREYDINSTGEKTDDVRGSLFMSKEEIDKEIQTFETVLSDYSTDNLEIFSQQITEITDKQKIIDLKKALETAREIYNISRLLGHTQALENLNIKLISQLLTEVSNRLHLLNLQASMNEVDSQQLLNTAIEEIIFDFTKVGEEELKMLANDLQDIAHKTRNELANNRNQKDPERISLYEEFRNLLNKHNIDETNPSVQWNFETTELKRIYEKIHELNRKNSVLQVKFSGDKKYARIFKYLE